MRPATATEPLPTLDSATIVPTRTPRRVSLMGLLSPCPGRAGTKSRYVSTPAAITRQAWIKRARMWSEPPPPPASRPSTNEVAMAAGTLPMASWRTTLRSTVCWRRCCTDPTARVTSVNTSDVATATAGWTLRTRMRNGVRNDPPPTPVSPTEIPTPKPKRTTSRSDKENAPPLAEMPTR